MSFNTSLEKARWRNMGLVGVPFLVIGALFGFKFQRRAFRRSGIRTQHTHRGSSDSAERLTNNTKSVCLLCLLGHPVIVNTEILNIVKYSR